MSYYPPSRYPAETFDEWIKRCYPEGPTPGRELALREAFRDAPVYATEEPTP